MTAAINIDPTSDNPKKEKPLESDIDRFVRLLSCKFVDSVTYYEGEKELEALYRFGDYNIAFISIEHEKSYTPTHKAKPVFVPRLSKHSSTRLRRKMVSVSDRFPLETISKDEVTSPLHNRESTVESHSLEFHAERQHQIWGHWMEYQFSLCEELSDGSLIIPAEKVERWKRQLATSYDELSEEERESDRQVVREHLPEVLQ